MKSNKVSLLTSLSDVFLRLSITVNLTVYTIYLIYLIHTIVADIGVMVINIILALLTLAFMVVYVVLRLSGRRKSKELKQIKRYYKRVKLIAQTVSAITAVYSLIVAFASVSPFALIVSILGAVFMIIRLIVEVVSYHVQRKLRRLKDAIVGRFKKDNPKDAEADEEIRPRTERRKRNKGEVPKFVEEFEEKIVPIDDCLLSDIEKI